MKSILLITFNTKRGLVLLDDQFEDDLKRKSFLIFGLYAVVFFLFNFNQVHETRGFLMIFFEMIISICISILMGKFTAYILFKIGKCLGGKGSYIEILSLYAYTFIPIMLALILVWILKNIAFLTHEFNNAHLRNIILFLSWFISYKILVQGLKKFNHFGIKKALINSLPILSLGIYELYIVYEIYNLSYN